MGQYEGLRCCPAQSLITLAPGVFSAKYSLNFDLSFSTNLSLEKKALPERLVFLAKVFAKQKSFL